MADKIVAVFQSGSAEVTQPVVLFESTWTKIQEKHATEAAPIELEHIQAVLEAPTAIVRSKKEGIKLTKIFTNNSVGTPNSKVPLCVPVKIVSDTEAIVTSAYYTDVTSKGNVIWTKSDANG